MKQIKNGQDEFYTSDAIAANLVQLTINKLPTVALFVEPSAGTGAFVKPLLKLKKTVVAYDINPKHPHILQADFFDLELTTRITEEITVSIGNPPFGFASNKAIKFFNSCAKFSDYIAFIVPRTFKKISTHNKLDKNFHLHTEYPIQKYAFVVDDKPYDVPCVFQIWEKKEYKRALKVGNLGKYLKLVSPEEADFAMRRVGGKAGQLLNGLDHNPSSTYFFKEMTSGVKACLEIADFTEEVNNTVGVRSISQLEIFEYLQENI